MKLGNWNERLVKSIVVITMLAALVGTITGCEEFGGFPAPAEKEEKPEKVVAPTVISTKDRAILAVYEHLLSNAESHEAKAYLAEFYTTSDNWTVESEYFKDGSGVWYVVVDMTDVEEWEEKPYWQQASWFVFRDGKVVSSHLLEANALRIEADLQELSPEVESKIN